MNAPDLPQAAWRKSSRSTSAANCVEVAFGLADQERATAVRDSKNPNGPALVVPATSWTRFLSTV